MERSWKVSYEIVEFCTTHCADELAGKGKKDYNIDILLGE